MELSKNKECKKCYHKKSQLQKFSSMYKYSKALFWNLALALVLALHCYCGDNVKYRLLSKLLFQRKQQNGG